MKTVTVIGEGAWGTAISTLLAHNGYTVFLWCHDEKVKIAIEEMGSNERYLPTIKLSKKIVPTTDLNSAIQQSSWIFETTPVKFLRNVVACIDPKMCENKPWVILSKGIEKETLFVPSQIIESVLKKHITYCVCFGPSFAHELAHQQLTAFSIASNDNTLAHDLQIMLESDHCKTYLSHDPHGIQLCGALKNVIALCIGILAGSGYGENTKAFILTQSLQEIAHLLLAYGVHKETAYGLAGVGDLILTALSKHSRNFQTGFLLGQGKKLETILQETGMVPEGINTVESVRQLIVQKKLNLPILNGIYDIIFNHELLYTFLNNLK